LPGSQATWAAGGGGQEAGGHVLGSGGHVPGDGEHVLGSQASWLRLALATPQLPPPLFLPSSQVWRPLLRSSCTSVDSISPVQEVIYL
jgi:hypothetical protein